MESHRFPIAEVVDKKLLYIDLSRINTQEKKLQADSNSFSLLSPFLQNTLLMILIHEIALFLLVPLNDIHNPIVLDSTQTSFLALEILYLLHSVWMYALSLGIKNWH
ncbi:hypothetical protein ACJX0J_010918 [Zea mays]